MPRAKRVDNVSEIIPAPAFTLEQREDQLASLAYNLAEQRLRDGSASNSLIEKFIDRGSSKAKLENEKLRRENELLVAKVKAVEASSDIKELYIKAMKAMKEYTGDGNDDETDN